MAAFKKMLHKVDWGMAQRAVDAWMRRTLPTRASPRIRDLLKAPTRNVWRAHRILRKSLISAIVAARITENFCRDRVQGKSLLVARLRSVSETAIVARVGELEEKLAVDDDELRQRYRRFVQATRNLLDPESAEPLRLLNEICWELHFSIRGRRVPWVRRAK